MTYLDCWIGAASALFSQALAGEPRLEESLPRPMNEGTLAFTATIGGDPQGRFTVVLERGILEVPLLGEGVDQQGAWGELLREAADAACGELLARGGQSCRVEAFESSAGEAQVTAAFQLKCKDRAWTILVRDEVRDEVKAAKKEEAPAAVPADRARDAGQGTAAGLEILLDVELEATLRFGCRELPLGEILALGPGDVVQLDRHITDPADLIVGDKIVARGEVVLVNGNFGLRVTEVEAPRKRLETIRCLF